jgi:hypothetical protein
VRHDGQASDNEITNPALIQCRDDGHHAISLHADGHYTVVRMGLPPQSAISHRQSPIWNIDLQYPVIAKGCSKLRIGDG